MPESDGPGTDAVGTNAVGADAVGAEAAASGEAPGERGLGPDLGSPRLPDRLDELAAALAAAWTMPLSGALIANGPELLALVEHVRDAVPGELYRAREVLEEARAGAEAAAAEAERLVAEARATAEDLVEGARTRAATLVAEHTLVVRAEARADRIVADARAAAAEHLAELEVALGRMTARVATDLRELGSDGAESAAPAADGALPEGR